MKSSIKDSFKKWASTNSSGQDASWQPSVAGPWDIWSTKLKNKLIRKSTGQPTARVVDDRGTDWFTEPADDVYRVRGSPGRRMGSFADLNYNLNFPKIAYDLLDIEVFSKNVTQTIKTFMQQYLPATIKLDENIYMTLNDPLPVIAPVSEVYPTIIFQPEFVGPIVDLNKFKKSVGDNREMFLRGSFLKNKTTNLITGLKVTNIVFHYPAGRNNVDSHIEKPLL